jgi:hypothetical protein
MIVILDDAQWADVDTAEFFADLVRVGRDSKLLLLQCVRHATPDPVPSYLAAWRNRRRTGFSPAFSELEVQALDARSVQTIIQSVSPRVVQDDSSRRSETLDNLMLLRAWLRSDGVADPSILAPAHLVPWPELDDPSRTILGLLSVARGSLSLERIRDTELGVRPLRAALARLERMGFIQVSAGSYSLAHDLLRESVRSHLSDSELTSLHRALAAAFERPPSDAADRVHHLVGARESALALRLASDLVIVEEQRGNQARAAALYELLIELSEESEKDPLRFAHARCLLRAGRCVEAGLLFDQLLSRAHDVPPSARADAVHCWLNAGRPIEAMASLGPLLRTANINMPRGSSFANTVRLLAQIPGLILSVRKRHAIEADRRVSTSAELAWRTGRSLVFIDHPVGMNILLQGARISCREGDRLHLYRVLSFLAGNVFSQIPRARNLARRILAELRTSAGSTGDSSANAHADLWESMLHMFSGEWIAMRDAANRAARQFAEHADLAWELNMADILLCFALLRLGAYRDCSSLAHEKASSCRRLGFVHAAVIFAMDDDLPALARGECELVRRRTEWVEESWLPGQYTIQSFYCNSTRAYAELAEGNAARALEIIDGQHRDFSKAGGNLVSTSRIDHALVEARVLLVQDAEHPGTHRARVREIVKRLSREERRDAIAHAHAFRGASLVGQNDEAALKEFNAAVKQFDDASMRVEAAVVRFQRAHITGDAEDAAGAASAMRSEGIADPSHWSNVMLAVSPRT